MKLMTVFLVTYRRSKILNKTLEILFNKTDFPELKDTAVYLINNHSEFELDRRFADRVTVLHNATRPDWDCGNLARNWNEALLHGFRDLRDPASEIVVTMQNDIVLSPRWATNLLRSHERYTFVTGCLGDNIVSYRPEAVRKIGMWDERFLCPAVKEADYYIRALIFNKDKSLIADLAHKRYLNAKDALPLDEKIYQGDEEEWKRVKHQELPLEAWYHSSQVFYYKWKDTWKEQPRYDGWFVNWRKDFVDNPPSPPKAPSFAHYYYFEKDIELKGKNYVGWRDGDLWLDAGKECDIDVHPFKPNQRFRE